MKLVFTQCVDLGGEVASFEFTPVEPLTWVAGQSIKIEVPGPYGPLEHRFTISSAPYEKHITITTRLSGSDFKNSLAALQPGQQVNAHAVEGDVTWRESLHPHVFVAAGIGITAFHTMLKQRVFEGKPLDTTLIYSSTAPHIFTTELAAWAQKPEFTITYLTRRVESADIPKTDGLVYLSGPSLMVDELSAALLRRNFAEKQLVRDWFTGRL